MTPLAVLAFSALSLLGLGAEPPRNIVVVFVDQLSQWATDPAQRAPLDLPALDALAASGTTYMRCYATSPVCSANRLTLLTGQYPFTLGTDKLFPGVPHFGSILSDAGWDTGYVGKWHLSPNGGAASKFVDPADRQGWRYFAGNEGAPHNYLAGLSFKQNETTPVRTAPWESTWNTTEAVRFLRTNRTRPFALVVNYGPPHPGGAAPSVYSPTQISPRPNVSFQNWSSAAQRIAQYMDLTLSTDTELGVLLAEINLANTFVVFTSDHGDMLYSQGMPGNQQKRRPWEEASHIPLIIAGPGIASGVTNQDPISTVDLLPSMLRLLGVSAPPAAQGSAFPDPSPIYFGQDHPHNSWLGERWRALLDDTLKYAVSEGGTELLYDLASDPYELTNLIADPAQAATLQSMRRAIQSRAADLEDPFFRTP